MIYKWRSIRPVEINQYNMTMATHYDTTMANDVARDAYCNIKMGNDIARNIHCDITMSNGVGMCTYHGITMHNHITMNLFYYVLSALCLIMIFVWVVCNKTMNKFMFDQLGWRTHLLFLCSAISRFRRTHEISLHEHNSCVLPRLIKHSLVLHIVFVGWNCSKPPYVKCTYKSTNDYMVHPNSVTYTCRPGLGLLEYCLHPHLTR